LSRGQSLLALTGLCSLMPIAAVASVFLNSDLLAMGLCTAILALLIAGRIFGHHEVSLLFRRLARFPRYWPFSHVATLAEDSVVSDPRASTVTLRFRDAAHSREEVLQKAA
jgi:hypothetical protein